MRLDLFLKKVRLIKRRAIAKQLIESGVVRIQGEKTKPSKNVYPGMRIKLGDITYEITAIPDKEIIKNEGVKYYKVIEDAWDNSG